MWEGLTQIQQKIIIREIRGIRVFFNLPQIQTLGKFVGTLIIGALRALRALGALGNSLTC